MNLRGLKDQIILTPNHNEFKRLYNQIFPKNDNDFSEESIVEKVKCLSQKLELCIIKKGAVDVITDGNIGYCFFN